MILLATFPKKVRVKCEVCNKEQMVDKAYYNSVGVKCCIVTHQVISVRDDVVAEATRQAAQSSIVSEIMSECAKLKHGEIIEFAAEDFKQKTPELNLGDSTVTIGSNIVHMDLILTDQAPKKRGRKNKSNDNK